MLRLIDRWWSKIEWIFHYLGSTGLEKSELCVTRMNFVLIFGKMSMANCSTSSDLTKRTSPFIKRLGKSRKEGRMSQKKIYHNHLCSADCITLRVA